MYHLTRSYLPPCGLGTVYDVPLKSDSWMIPDTTLHIDVPVQQIIGDAVQALPLDTLAANMTTAALPHVQYMMPLLANKAMDALQPRIPEMADSVWKAVEPRLQETIDAEKKTGTVQAVVAFGLLFGAIVGGAYYARHGRFW